MMVPALGIVFKFPRIRLIRAWHLTGRLLGKGARAHLWDNLKLEYELPIEHSMSGVRGLLFRGIVANWREWRFYQTTRHPFLQPTYCSVLGLLNVQKYGEPCAVDYHPLWVQLLDITQGDVWDDNHHFSNPDNFCVSDGTLRMVDYGSSRGQVVILVHGHAILENFDLQKQATDSYYA